MDDKTLLELAAKAAGYDVCWHHANQCFMLIDGDAERKWRPDVEDGDALRLAVKLKLEVYHGSDEKGDLHGVVYFMEGSSRPTVAMEYHGDHSDDLSACRRAIVRAAAELGKQMP